MVQKRRSRERNICTVYTQRATEEEIRRRNQEERIQNQGYGEIGSKDQGHSSQERPIQEGKMQQSRLLRLPVRRQGKRKLQQRKQNTEYRVPKTVDGKTYTKEKQRTARTQEDKNISRNSTAEIRNRLSTTIAKPNTRET